MFVLNSFLKVCIFYWKFSIGYKNHAFSYSISLSCLLYHLILFYMNLGCLSSLDLFLYGLHSRMEVEARKLCLHIAFFFGMMLAEYHLLKSYCH